MGGDVLDPRLLPCGPHHVINCLICHPRPIVDYSADEIRGLIIERRREGFTCFAKWTCPSCEKRVAGDQPNIVPEECTCPECGHICRPSGYGLLLIKKRV